MDQRRAFRSLAVMLVAAPAVLRGRFLGGNFTWVLPVDMRYVLGRAMRCLALSLVAGTLAPIAGRAGPGEAQEPLSGEQEVSVDTAVVLANVIVVDGTGAPPIPGQTIVIQEGRILQIGRHGEVAYPAPSVVHDLSGHFVIPGLTDGHTHVSGGSRKAVVERLAWAVRGGVTTIRDMAGSAPLLGGIAGEVQRGEILAPDLFYSAIVAGPDFMEDPRAIRSSRPYPLGTAPWLQQVTATSNPSEIIATVRGTGASAVKIYADVDPTLFAALTSEAHRRGLKVWAHGTVFPVLPMEQVDAGADALSHAPYLIWQGSPRIDDFKQRALGDFENVPVDGPAMTALLSRMAEKGTALDATLWYFHRELEDSLPRARAAWGRAITKRAHEMGVPILAGTDGLGNPERDDVPNIHAELEALVDAGLSPAEALKAATLNPARVLDRDATHGSVASGKVADLVVLSADPTEDITNTRSIVMVIRRGRLVNR